MQKDWESEEFIQQIIIIEAQILGRGRFTYRGLEAAQAYLETSFFKQSQRYDY